MYEKEMREASPNRLGKHIAWTYFALRILLFVLAVSFPLSLWAWSWGRFGTVEPGPSISGYYYAEWTLIGDHFVGTLSAVGICLIAYRGFTTPENWLLNAAGVCVIGVAMCPTNEAQAPRFSLCGNPGEATEAASQAISLHGVFAVVFFVCLALVAWREADFSLRLITDEKYQKRKRNCGRAYKLIAVLMVVLPALAWIVVQSAKRHWAIFAVEAVGVWVFAAYWLVKTLEFRGTNGEPEAVLIGSDVCRKT